MTEEIKKDEAAAVVETPAVESPVVEADGFIDKEMVTRIENMLEKESKAAEEAVPAVPDKPVETPVVAPPKAEEVNSGEPAKHEEPPVVEEVSSDAGDEWDVDLLARAADMGVTDAYIEKFLKTPERLESYLSKLTEKKGVTAPVTDKSKQDDERFEKSLEGVDEEIANTLREERSERKRLNNEIAELREQSAKREKIDADRQKKQVEQTQAELTAKFENGFNAISEQYPEVGKGSYDAVKGDKKALENRDDIADEFYLLRMRKEAKGERVDFKELFDKAVQRVLGTVRTQVTKEIASKLEVQSKSILSRPSGTSSSTAKIPQTDEELFSATRSFIHRQ